MSTTNSNSKNKWGKWVKYFIFNFMLLGAFFTFNVKDVEAEEVTPSFVLHQSNYYGNNGRDDDGDDATTKFDAFHAAGKCADGTDSNCFKDWYIQGTGIAEKDIVTFTLTVPFHGVNGIVFFETGYTSSARHWQAYKLCQRYRNLDRQGRQEVSEASCLRFLFS